MAIVSSGLLETYTPSVSTQADQNIINQKVADNIESLRRFGIGIGDITSLHSHTAITADNFTLYKKAGFISFYQFNSSTGNIDGVFDGATLAEGDQFLLVNKASTPSTNSVTLALGSYSLLGSSDTSIVINSNSVYVYLVYIGSDKFIRITHNTDILEQNNTWSGTNNFTGSVDIASLSLGSGGTTVGLEIGNSYSTGGLSFIDMKYGITAGQDYNIRQMVNGNETFLCATATKNIYSFSNSSFNFGVHLYPTADGVLNVGSASLRVNEYWGVNGAIQTSMEEQKDEIEDLEIGLDFILELQPKHYKMKNIPEKTQKVKKYRKKINEVKLGTKNIQTVGLEEYEEDEIIPEVKYTRKHTGLSTKDVKHALDKFGISTMNFAGYIKDKITGLEGLRYIEFIPILIKSIQDQNKIIQDLKNELQELKNNV